MAKKVNTTLETIVAAGILAAIGGIYLKITHDYGQIQNQQQNEHSSSAPVTTGYR